jgi:hypothetical protein
MAAKFSRLHHALIKPAESVVFWSRENCRSEGVVGKMAGTTTKWPVLTNGASEQDGLNPILKHGNEDQNLNRMGTEHA